MTTDLRYPIGPFTPPDEISDDKLTEWIEDIETLPRRLRDAVTLLTDEQLDTRYRSGGWTVRQVVHHLADSHLNSVVRFKWALTEDEPPIKAYFEDRWAELGDYEAPIELSLDFLDTLHARWVVLLRSLGADDLERAFLHPEWGRTPLRVNVGIYAWHGRHHLAHITHLAQRQKW